MKRKVVQHCDDQILLFLWKWRIASAHALKAMFMNDLSDLRAYKRLKSLSSRRLIAYVDKGFAGASYWCLNKNGFRRVREMIPGLKVNDYKVNSPRRDFLTMAIQSLGSFGVSSDKHIDFISNNQLSCMDYSALSLPEPSSRSEHTPAGMWVVREDKPTAISFEIEFPVKPCNLYSEARTYYCFNSWISRVIWVVRDADRIQKLSNKFTRHYGENDMHNFVLFRDFFRDGWQVKIADGPDRGTELCSLLRTKSGQAREKCLIDRFLAQSKTCRTSASCSIFKSFFDADCIRAPYP